MSILSLLPRTALLAVLSTQTLAAPAQQPAPGLPLKIVERSQFCGRLANVFANYGQTSGYDRVQQTLLASGATASVMQEFRSGRATDFINANALAQFSNVPSRNPDAAYIPLAGIMAG